MIPGGDEALAQDLEGLRGGRKFTEAFHLGIEGWLGAGFEVASLFFSGGGDTGTKELDAGSETELANATILGDSSGVKSGGDAFSVVRLGSRGGVVDKIGQAEFTLGEVE